MLPKIAIALCLAGTLLAADAHKPEEHKAEPKKVETHSPEPPKPTAKHEESKAEVKHEEAKPSPVKAPDPKPAVVEARRPTPRMTPRRNLAARVPLRAVRTEPAPVAAPKPAPIVVEVKQEPARVEAVLRIIPYGAPYGVPGPVYPNQAFSVSSLNTSLNSSFNSSPNAPRPQAPAESIASPEAADAPRETMVGIFGPANFVPGPPPLPGYQSAQGQRLPTPPSTLKKAPKNALTNEGLVILAEAGYDEEFILDLMKMKNCRFDTTAEGLAYMATHGLTERIVKAALQVDIESELKAPALEARR